MHKIQEKLTTSPPEAIEPGDQLEYSGLTLEYTKIDAKSRVGIPGSLRGHFSGVAYAQVRDRLLLLGPQPYEGLACVQFVPDSASRILFGKPLVNSLLGLKNLNTDIPKEGYFVLWVPRYIQDRVDFLLFFGDSGMQRYQELLAIRESSSPVRL